MTRAFFSKEYRTTNQLGEGKKSQKKLLVASQEANTEQTRRKESDGFVLYDAKWNDKKLEMNIFNGFSFEFVNLRNNTNAFRPLK